MLSTSSELHAAARAAALALAALLPCSGAIAQAPGARQPVVPPASRPLINQLGFKAGWNKEAFIATAHRDSLPLVAMVNEASSGKVLMTVNFGPPREDQASGDWIRTADLSGLRGPGRYSMHVAGAEPATFSIGENVYAGLQRALVRAFYLQRCGKTLDDAETGLAHAACHVSDGAMANSDNFNAQGQPKSAAGGWHDAGDYGKYVATTSVAIGRVLEAYERAPARFADDATGIPESGNGIPDILDEMAVGLDWMLTMQRPDGAVYRKIGGAHWPHDKAPQDDLQPRLLFGVSSPDAAKAAAAWAQAARLYRTLAPVRAERYLAAARSAWQWLQALRASQYVDARAGDDSGSGPYIANDIDDEASLQHDRDDRLWAATELYLSTTETVYLREMERLVPDAPLNLFEWKDPSALAMSYLLWHPLLKDRQALAAQVRPRFMERARKLAGGLAGSGWRIANPRFVWGSNKMTAEEGIMLCLAYQIGGNPEYLAAARDQLHYALGRNHFGKSFVSGVGTDAVREVSHLWFQVIRRPIPGLFVGGPNASEQSGIAPAGMGPLSWADDTRSYATNEFALDYNASLIGLLASLETDCHTHGGGA